MVNFDFDGVFGEVSVDEARDSIKAIITQHSVMNNIDENYLIQLYDYNGDMDSVGDYANIILSIFFTTIEAFTSRGSYKIHAFYTPPQLRSANSIVNFDSLNAFNCPLNFSPFYRDNGESDYLYTLLQRTLSLTLNAIPQGFEYSPSLFKILLKDLNGGDSIMFHWNIFPMNIIGVDGGEMANSINVSVKGWDIFNVHLDNFKEHAKFINKWVITISGAEKEKISLTFMQLFRAFFVESSRNNGHYRLTSFVREGLDDYSGVAEWLIDDVDGDVSVIPVPREGKTHDAFELISLTLNGYFDNCSIVFESNFEGKTNVSTWSVIGEKIIANSDDEVSKILWRDTDSIIVNGDEDEVNFVEAFPIELS